jgi:integrase
MPKERTEPTYQLHKPSGQARTVIDGKSIYLGKYNSAESQERFDDLKADWRQRRNPDKYRITIDDLALRYVDHCDIYYRKNGEPTGEADNIRRALRSVIELHGRMRANEFGPTQLRSVRDAMIQAGYVRRAINVHVSRIRRMFKWGAANEYVRGDVWQTLAAVDGLKHGRSKARESKPVPPVAEGTVNDTLPHLPEVVADMVRLQLLTGARPTEVCTLRPCDITRGTNGVWTYRPEHHKTEHHGRERRIFIGPDGQAILTKYLDRDPEAFCFTPAEAAAEHSARRRANRRTPMTPSQAARKGNARTLRDRYTKDSYNRAVCRACEAAFGMPVELRDVGRTVAKMEDATEAQRDAAQQRLSAEAAVWRAKYCWSPNQLRHSRATAIRERYGIEAAQTVLGHADPRVTEIYAERDFAMAAKIMREIG